MIHLILLLFILQGSSSEMLETCSVEFEPNTDYDISAEIYFCQVAHELELTEKDVDKLGLDVNWFNYTMQTANEFVSDWDFYQNNAIEDTLLIYPSIGTREVLPPHMKVQISFDYKDGDTISKFDESFQISPLCDPSISHDGVCNLKVILDISPRPNLSHQYEISLKQQIDDDLSFNEILCPNNNHVLVERTNGKLACVYDDTAEKFNWIIQDEYVRENLWLINHPAVKNCVPKQEGDAWPSMGYENRTHSFDVEFCEWILK